MNFNEISKLLIPFALALATTMGLRYFFSRHEGAETIEIVRSGQRFVAPKSTEIEVHKPLNLEIDFSDAKNAKQPTVTSFETENAFYEFSSEGASLRRLEFRRNWGEKEGFLSTVFPPAGGDREKRCFLVALEEKTPLAFELVNHQEDDKTHTLTYRAPIENGYLNKKFVVYKHEYRIDLEVGFEANSVINQKARIFIPSPLVSELAGEDLITVIANDERNKVKMHSRNAETASSYWSHPTLFGAQDRYFIHALVNDPQQFTQRGYFKPADAEMWYSVLEGPEVAGNASWNLTFYMGPKEDQAMAQVDSRLEETLNYGMFSFISKPLSQLMLRALEAIYGVVHNYGWAIIILTILLKLLLLPFTWRGEQSLKKRMEFQKKLDHIQHKYKHDKEALAEARAELIRKHGMPGMAGCIPLLLQLPIFWALSIILSNAIQLYKAPFLWIPDLTARDPYYILPILIFIGMVLHAPAGNDPKQRVSSIGMALVFAAVLSSFSSGLALFTIVSTFLGVAQAQIMKVLKYD
ncbi:MAG TPA: YidC/Oxa1 family insertase periplasmic-domain containing protein [Candidatus Babeliales bacterium]|nr:YidC/Oxa1 family insertase periplasmic-domain containing protein [Candidatus Babeliales bacterium]